MVATNGNPTAEAVVIYARVSSGRQEQEATVESQLEALRAHAREHGYRTVQEFVDEAYSGATLERPALDRLRDGARAGAFRRVLILAPDRLARKVGYQFVILEELQKAGVAVEFLQGQPADTPEGQLLLTMQGAVAEYERAKIGERTRRGKMHWAKRGGLMGGYTPYGYRYVARDGERRATLEVDEAKAAVVRDIFRWVVEEGASCRGIAKRLTDERVPTPGGADHWRESTVNRILRQRAYAGTFLYHRHEYVEPEHAPQGGYRKNRKTSRRRRPEADWIEVPVPAIVTPEVFAETQRRLADNAHFAPRNNKRHDYLLKGLVRCGRCGAAMTGAVSHGKRMYRCTASDPYNVGERKACRPAPWTDADGLEAQVWDTVRDLLRNPETLREEFERRLREAGAADALDLREQALRRQLKQVERQQNLLLDIYQAEEVDQDELRRRLGELKRQKEQAERELADVKERREERARLQDVHTAFEEFLRDINAGLDTLEFAGRQQTLRLLLRGVIVDVDGGVIRLQTILPTVPKVRSGPGAQPTSSIPAQLRRAGGDPGVDGAVFVATYPRPEQGINIPRREPALPAVQTSDRHQSPDRLPAVDRADRDAQPLRRLP